MPDLGANDGVSRLARARAAWDQRPIHRYLGLTLQAVEDGYARFYLVASENNRGGIHGAVHGGVLALIADVAALAAISTLIEKTERAAGTAELNISYLRPAMGSVVGEGRVLRKGRTLVVADVDLSDDHGKLLAKGRVSYAIHDMDAAATPMKRDSVDNPRGG